MKTCVQNGCAQYVGLVTSDYLGVVLGVAAGILLLQVISTNIHELYYFFNTLFILHLVNVLSDTLLQLKDK